MDNSELIAAIRARWEAPNVGRDDAHWTVSVDDEQAVYPTVSVYLNGVRLAWTFGDCVYDKPQDGLALSTGYECIVTAHDRYVVYPDRSGPHETVEGLVASMAHVIRMNMNGGAKFTMNGCPVCGHIWDDVDDTDICPESDRHQPEDE